MSFQDKLKKYASLIVCSGLNVQKGQTVVISGSIESYELIREVTRQAYQIGAGEVVVSYSDDVITKMKYENLSAEQFNHVPAWLAAFKNDYARENACFLYIDDSDPELLSGIEAEKISNWQKAAHQAFAKYYELSDNMTVSWCIAGGATKQWANKVFPDMSDQEAIYTRFILWGRRGRSAKVGGTEAMRSTTSIPCTTCPKAA